MKNSDIFHISSQNLDCGYSFEPPRRCETNEYPQSMFFEQNKKNNVYPCKPQFYHIKVGFKGVKLYRHFFVGVKAYFLGKLDLKMCSAECVVHSMLSVNTPM